MTDGDDDKKVYVLTVDRKIIGVKYYRELISAYYNKYLSLPFRDILNIYFKDQNSDLYYYNGFLNGFYCINRSYSASCFLGSLDSGLCEIAMAGWNKYELTFSEFASRIIRDHVLYIAPYTCVGLITNFIWFILEQGDINKANRILYWLVKSDKYEHDLTFSINKCFDITSKKFNWNMFYRCRLFIAYGRRQYFIDKMLYNNYYKTKKQDFCLGDFITAGTLFKRATRSAAIFVGSGGGRIDREASYELVGKFMKKYYHLKIFSLIIYEKWIDYIISEYDWVGQIKYIKENYIIGKNKKGDFIYGIPIYERDLYSLMLNLDVLYCLCVNFTDGDLRKLVGEGPINLAL